MRRRAWEAFPKLWEFMLHTRKFSKDRCKSAFGEFSVKSTDFKQTLANYLDLIGDQCNRKMYKSVFNLYFE